MMPARATLAVLLGAFIWHGSFLSAAKDLMVPKEQATTEFEPTVAPSLDEQKRGVPQSIFVCIKMANG